MDSAKFCQRSLSVLLFHRSCNDAVIQGRESVSCLYNFFSVFATYFQWDLDQMSAQATQEHQYFYLLATCEQFLPYDMVKSCA